MNAGVASVAPNVKVTPSTDIVEFAKAELGILLKSKVIVSFPEFPVIVKPAPADPVTIDTVTV